MKKLNCVLLVDDDEINNIIGYSLIKRQGVAEKIQTSNNGISALNFLRRYSMHYKNMPDLIILDIEMPVMDGLEFYKATNNLFYIDNHQTSIVFLTNYPTHTQEFKSKIPENVLVVEKVLDENKLNSILDYHQNYTSLEWTKRSIKKLYEKAK